MARDGGVGPLALGSCSLVARGAGTLSLAKLNLACENLRRALPQARVWLRAVATRRPSDTTPGDEVHVTSGNPLIEIDGVDKARAASALHETARMLPLPCSVET